MASMDLLDLGFDSVEVTACKISRVPRTIPIPIPLRRPAHRVFECRCVDFGAFRYFISEVCIYFYVSSLKCVSTSMCLTSITIMVL